MENKYCGLRRVSARKLSNTMSKLVFSSCENEILIREIQNNPIPYYKAAEDYKTKTYRDCLLNVD